MSRITQTFLLASFSDGQRHRREGLLDNLESHLLVYDISIMCKESSKAECHLSSFNDKQMALETNIGGDQTSSLMGQTS